MLFRADGGSRIYRRHNERYTANCVLGQDRFGCGSVMVVLVRETVLTCLYPRRFRHACHETRDRQSRSIASWQEGEGSKVLLKLDTPGWAGGGTKDETAAGS